MDHFSATLAQQAASDVTLKVILVGESGAGKSSTLQRFTRNSFTEQTISTIAVDFQIKNTTISGKRVTIQVWDTAGQEKYYTITTGYYRQADAVLLVCDLTNLDSFVKLNKWMEEVRRFVRPGTPCALLGNKSDLSAQRQLDSSVAIAWAQQQGIPFFETSAREGSNVEAAFDHVCEQAVSIKLEREASFRAQAPPSSAASTPARRSDAAAAAAAAPLSSSPTRPGFALDESDPQQQRPASLAAPSAASPSSQASHPASVKGADPVVLRSDGSVAQAPDQQQQSSSCAC